MDSGDGKNKMSTKFGRKFNTDNDDNFVGGGSQQFQVRWAKSSDPKSVSGRLTIAGGQASTLQSTTDS